MCRKKADRAENPVSEQGEKTKPKYKGGRRHRMNEVSPTPWKRRMRFTRELGVIVSWTDGLVGVWYPGVRIQNNLGEAFQ